MIEWFLVLSVMSCGNCNREVQIAMPSIEVCRVVRDLNSGSKCVTTDSASDGDRDRQAQAAMRGRKRRRGLRC